MKRHSGWLAAAWRTAYGVTGHEMEALPIRMKDGRAGSSDGEHVLLDDVGATVLHLAGVNPRHYGYDGKILEFLV